MNLERSKNFAKDKLAALLGRNKIHMRYERKALNLSYRSLFCMIMCIILPLARTDSGVYVFLWSYLGYTCIKKRKEYMFFGLLCSIVPLFTFGFFDSLRCLVQFGCMLLYPYIVRGELNILSAAFYTASVTLILSLGMAFLEGAMLIGIIYCLCESLLCICFVPILSRAMDCVDNLKNKTVFTTQDSLCICVLLSSIISSLCNLNVFGVNISLVLSVVLIGLCVASVGDASALFMSVMCGVSLCVFAKFSFSYTALLCIGCVVGIMFRDLSAFTSLAMLLFSLVMGSFMLYDINVAVKCAIACGIGCSVALFTYKYIGEFVKKVKNNNAITPIALSETITSIIKDEVIMQKKMLGELSRNMEMCDVAESGEVVKTICKMVASDVCSGCVMKTKCWVDEADDTCNVFDSLINSCIADSAITYNNLPNRFITKCAHNQVMFKTICSICETFKLKQNYRLKLMRFKSIINNQFLHLNRILDRMNSKISSGVKLNVADSTEALNALQNEGINTSEVYAMEKPSKKQTVIIKCKEALSDVEARKTVPIVLGEALGKSFTYEHKTIPDERAGSYSYTYNEEYTYRLSTGFACCCKDTNIYSGDKNSNAVLSNGMHMLAICDGMGCGKKAGHQSERVLNMLEEMLNCGYDETEAIDMVNSILVLDERDEIFTALDLFLFDLNKGVGEFVKAGASPSYIKRGNETQIVSFDTLPVGILEETHIKKGLKKFQKGDYIYFMSDGFYECMNNNDEQISECILKYNYRNPQKIADAMFEDAINNSSGRASDDVSVMVVKVRQTSLA